MLRINQIKIPLGGMEEAVKKSLPHMEETPKAGGMAENKNVTAQKEKELIHKKVCKLLRTENPIDFTIVKKSIDARKGEIFFIYSVEISDNELKKLKGLDRKKKQWEKNRDFVWKDDGKRELLKKTGIGCPAGKKHEDKEAPPVVVGSGPAGIFCALTLSMAGLNPILIERGNPVEERVKKVQDFWDKGILDRECNVQFGEGGAGTFSDGKLNTMAGDKEGYHRQVLNTFVKYGAPEEILYINRPHVGTDRLVEVVKNIRNEIIRLGGQVLFNTRLTDIGVKETYGGKKLCSITVESRDGKENDNHLNKKTQIIPCECLVIAPGHSARDTFSMLKGAGVSMEKKPFAIGVRAEHLQEDIDRGQYGRERGICLPAADYKLTAKVLNRSVYSFCMCPGGYVVNASSEEGRLAVNGMSYSGRNGKNANSALVVSVTPEDFPGGDVLSGVEFQRKWEEQAYRAGNGKIPVQLYSDFCRNRTGSGFGIISSSAKGETEFANLRTCLPEYVSSSLIEAMKIFGGRIKGFDREDVVFSGVETRTSSPIRMLRNDDCQSISIQGIYPCGEGAGYAGGITSAAMDGIRVGEKIISYCCALSG